jgi:hypothetical protein
MSSSPAARAMFPNLARKEDEREAAKPRSIEEIKAALPTWATSNAPVWATPRRGPPNDAYLRDMGLVKVSKRR